jgi:hypothetical protein
MNQSAAIEELAVTAAIHITNFYYSEYRPKVATAAHRSASIWAYKRVHTDQRLKLAPKFNPPTARHLVLDLRFRASEYALIHILIRFQVVFEPCPYTSVLQLVAQHSLRLTGHLILLEALRTTGTGM